MSQDYYKDFYEVLVSRLESPKELPVRKLGEMDFAMCYLSSYFKKKGVEFGDFNLYCKSCHGIFEEKLLEANLISLADNAESNNLAVCAKRPLVDSLENKSEVVAGFFLELDKLLIGHIFAKVNEKGEASYYFTSKDICVTVSPEPEEIKKYNLAMLQTNVSANHIKEGMGLIGVIHKVLLTE